MNIDETKKAIKVMQAYVDGEEIECKFKRSELWGTLADGFKAFDWHTVDYRVKPKPLECCVALDEFDNVIAAGNGGCILMEKEDTARVARTVTMREVI